MNKATENSDSAEIRSLSDLLLDLKASLTGETVSLDALIKALHERGIAMLLLFFAAPMALPIPVPPGINIMLASPLLLLTGQQALGRHTIWLPQKTRRKTMSCKKLSGLIDAIVPWLRKIELLSRPRLGFMTQDGISRLMGAFGFIMALTVCIPLPLTNTAPSFGIAMMSIGFLQRDGLAVIAGALFGMAWVTMLVLGVMIFGPEAFEIIKTGIKSLLGMDA